MLVLLLEILRIYVYRVWRDTAIGAISVLNASLSHGQFGMSTVLKCILSLHEVCAYWAEIMRNSTQLSLSLPSLSWRCANQAWHDARYARSSSSQISQLISCSCPEHSQQIQMSSGDKPHNVIVPVNSTSTEPSHTSPQPFQGRHPSQQVTMRAACISYCRFWLQNLSLMLCKEPLSPGCRYVKEHLMLL